LNSHRGPEEWWSSNATIEDWFDEMVGQANIINRFAGVRMEDIRGKLSKLLLSTITNNNLSNKMARDYIINTFTFWYELV
jgi:hypothetical protein